MPPNRCNSIQEEEEEEEEQEEEISCLRSLSVPSLSNFSSTQPFRQRFTTVLVSYLLHYPTETRLRVCRISQPPIKIKSRCSVYLLTQIRLIASRLTYTVIGVIKRFIAIISAILPELEIEVSGAEEGKEKWESKWDRLVSPWPAHRARAYSARSLRAEPPAESRGRALG